MKIEHVTLGRKALEIEREQLADEGRDTAGLESEFDRLLALDDSTLEGDQATLQGFFDRSIRLAFKPGLDIVEPSDLDGIRGERPGGPRRKLDPPDLERFAIKLHGAWLGRAAGCFLGKPVEGWTRAQITGYLKDLGRYPLDDYFRAEVAPEVAARYPLHEKKSFVDQVDHMPWDDDLNYSLAGMLILRKHGAAFSPTDVARFWLENFPVLTTWTAERTACRNFLEGFGPPESALRRNPYREWIGAQIRADCYGWMAPGKPERAAEWAWRDASISHVRNGIYGSMWVAATLAAAACLDSPREALLEGMKEIPAQCRLTRALDEVLLWRDEGLDYHRAVERIHARWDESNPHHWCHTISNAQVVALGLLWGEGDFSLSVCRAVEAGFDTDCNGATVGSVMGLILGPEGIPGKWTAPLGGRFDSSIPGRQTVEIESVARESFELWLSLNG